MKVESFLNILGADFFTGVPDSQLKALCNYLINTYGAYDPQHHIIGANEGNCTAIAAGYHLATSNIPVVYMQNSGEGNIINPVASLLNEKVYGIPAIFVIGWRGEPGIHDEPQHIYQGMVTLKLLDDMNIKSCVVSSETTEKELEEVMNSFRHELSEGRQVAFVIRKNALVYDEKVSYSNDNTMTREQIIQHITAVTGSDLIVSTTGKTSRELFETRQFNQSSHSTDFLTVGSMGHSSSIALGIAMSRPDRRIWCIDGDGAVLMHMGAMAVIAHMHPSNLIHIVINNGAHESVGGQPTVMGQVRISDIARDCGYPHTASVSTFDELDRELQSAKDFGELYFIEALSSIGARADLGRPTTTAMDNKKQFMCFINNTALI
jgi:phosphonopyruvate decarboxylase